MLTAWERQCAIDGWLAEAMRHEEAAWSAEASGCALSASWHLEKMDCALSNARALENECAAAKEE